jgi:hypothetical protein
MSTREPIPPSEGFELRWLQDGLRLLWRTPLFGFALAALPTALGFALLHAWEAVGHLIATPAMAAVAFALCVGVGAAALAPLAWLLFRSEGHPLPFSWLVQAALGWGAVATAWGLALALPIACLATLMDGQAPGALPSLLLVLDGAAPATLLATAVGASAMAKGVLALLFVGPYSLGFGLPEMGSVAYGAFFSRKARAKAPKAALLGSFFLACVLAGTVFNPLAGLVALAVLVPWLHVGARAMSGGGGIATPVKRTALARA